MQTLPTRPRSRPTMRALLAGLVLVALIAAGGVIAGASPARAVDAQVPTISWPTRDVVTDPGTPLGLWGVGAGSAPVEIAIQNAASGDWVDAGGAPVATQTWISVPRVDDVGTWRYSFTPTTPGAYELHARYAGAAIESTSGFTVRSADGGEPPRVPTEGFPLRIVNDTGVALDRDVWVTVIGQSSPGEWSYVDADGTVHRVDSAAQRGPDAVVKDGIHYAPMSFRLPASGTVEMPPSLQGGRVYLSVGAPLYLRIADDDSGIALPDPANPADPNANTDWDFYEFTFVDGSIAFGGNTTQVDQFSFPLAARVEQRSTGFVGVTAFTASRAEIFDRMRSLDGGYGDLVGEHRILAPRTSSDFSESSAASARMTRAIDEAWQRWRTTPLTLTADARPVTARVDDSGRLLLTSGDDQIGSVERPRAADVWSCSGHLAQGSTVELATEAQLCAAFNRGIAGEDPAHWSDASLFYASPSSNGYAALLHEESVDSAAYAFAYDDVADQSSVIILPNAAPPSLVTLTLQPWR